MDTNLNDVQDLSWYMQLPQYQVALFIMDRAVFNYAKKEKEGTQGKWEFRKFCQRVANGEIAKEM